MPESTRDMLTENAVLKTETVTQQLYWRYATKAFDPTRQIPDPVWTTLEQSLVLAPSSFGLQPWKFIVVRNPEIRQQLLEHSWGQTQVVDASHFVVFAIKQNIDEADVDQYVERMADVQDVSTENLEGYGSMVKGFLDDPPFPLNKDEWAARQVYVALGQFMTCAAMLGIDTCPMEGIVPAKYDEVLGLTSQDYSTVVTCAAGYRAPDDKHADRPKVRYTAETVIQYVD